MRRNRWIGARALPLVVTLTLGMTTPGCDDDGASGGGADDVMEDTTGPDGTSDGFTDDALGDGFAGDATDDTFVDDAGPDTTPGDAFPDAGPDVPDTSDDAGPDIAETTGDAGDTTDGDTVEPPPEPIELRGIWATSFGERRVISTGFWGSQAIAGADNEANVAVTQNPPDDQFNPDTFNKVVWTEPEDDRFWVCTVDFGLDSAEAAWASEATADDADPAMEGCGGFPWTQLRTPVELMGEWTIQGDAFTITAGAWGAAPLADWDNATNVAILQASEEEESFLRVVWTEANEGDVWTCLVDDGLDSVEAAWASDATADDTDPANGGCQGHPWTLMEPVPIEVAGVWESSFGGTFEITTWSWSGEELIEFDNDENVAITQLPPDDEFNPDTFNRVVWTEPADGAFWICTVDFGLDTAADALHSTATADATDPANGGCGGFPWTGLTEPEDAGE